ncbi:hypothetical protein, partial [Mycolicibacterium fallax]
MSKPWQTHGGGGSGSGADPFGGGGFGGPDPFGGGWGAPPAAPPPAPAPAPPVRPASARPAPARPAPASGARLPERVFAANLLLGGIAAVLVSTAALTLLALPEFRYQYREFGALTPTAVTLAAGLGGWAVAMLALVVGNRRGHRAARLLSVLNSAALIVASGVALVLRPGAQVGWFGALIWVIGPLLILAAVAAAVLLWPGIGRPSLPPPAARGDDAEATVVLRPAATPPRPA